ncbi:hypothetical protein L1049_006540 [Liquidambar formosana]|uniref:Uncharacterized protein n=1 Tax=Liquidambar formosana TaxID=63359 RepID=A0AAP0WTV7_LIQFO
MKKRVTRKSTATDLLLSPLPMASPSPSPPHHHHRPSDSPEPFQFNTFNNTSSAKKKKPIASTSALIKPTISPHPPQKTLATISDLKDLASSRLDSIKSNVDRSHSEILKDLEASQSRLHKRFKIQTQACQQVMDESEKEYKKMFERISESQEAMKASYAEFMAEVQVTASRVRKASIPELSLSFEKRLDVLQSRFGISSTQV